MKRRVVVTGVGVISPIGIGKDKFWESLKIGKSGGKRISAFDPSAFSTQIAGEVTDFSPENFIEPKKIKRMDRFCQFALAAAQIAVEDSKISLEKESCNRIGVIIGSGIGGFKTIEDGHTNLLTKGPGRVSPFFIPMLITDIASAEIAIYYKLKGPNFSVSSACATGNHALGVALRTIQYGDADVIISGGAEATITPLALAGFCSAGALSKRNDDPQHASRPFDKLRDGFVMGEGAGVVILEELEHALNRGANIYGEIIGFSATDDAYHITAPSPDGESATQAMRKALQDAGVSPQQVDYINAHGTSTPLNDKVETIAIKQLFGDFAYKIPISSIKSMTGHLLGAAGAVELISVLLMMKHSIIAPTINYEVKDEECDLNYVPNHFLPKEINIAISNSFGFGGHNSTLVIKKFNL